MSGSRKYLQTGPSEAQLAEIRRAEERRRLEREARERARREAERAAAEERWRRKREAERARLVASLRDAIERARAEASKQLSEHAERLGSDAAVLGARLREAAALPASGGPGELHSVLHQVEQCRNAIVSAIQISIGRERTAEVIENHQFLRDSSLTMLEHVEALIAALGASGQDAADLDEARVEARASIADGRVSEGHAALTELLGRCRSRLEQVEREREERALEEVRLEAELAAMEARRRALRESPGVLRWSGDQVERSALHGASAQAALEAGDLAIADKELTSAGGLLDQACRVADERERKEAERLHVVAALYQALRDLGYNPSRPYAEVDRHDDIVITTKRPDMRGTSVSVPADLKVRFDLEGFSSERVDLANGELGETSESAVEWIESIRSELEAREVRTGELEWDGKPSPDRLARDARELPPSTSQEERGTT